MPLDGSRPIVRWVDGEVADQQLTEAAERAGYYTGRGQAEIAEAQARMTYQTQPERLWSVRGAFSSGQLYTALHTLLAAEIAYLQSQGDPDYWDDLDAERARFETTLDERARQLAAGR